MTDEPRPAPQVAVSDPARATAPGDVLEAGPRPSSRRRNLVLAAGLAALALLGAGLQVRADGDEAARERRLQAVVDLDVQPEGTTSVYDPGTRTARLETRLLLGNRGPRDHVVEDASVGGFSLVRADVPLRAGQEAPLVLGATVRCTGARPAEVPTGPLVLQLRGERSARLPVELPVGPDAAARACGLVPLEEVAFVSVVGAARPGDALELALELGTQDIRPVQVLAVEVGPGLRAALRDSSGAPVAFPFPLPTGDGPGFVAGSYVLRIDVADCDAARAGAGSPVLALQLRSEDGRTARAETLYELGYLLDLLIDVC